MYIDNKPEEESPMKLEKYLVISVLTCIHVYSEKLTDTQHNGYYSKLAFFTHTTIRSENTILSYCITQILLSNESQFLNKYNK
jgi:hypothetical protein